MGPSRQRALAWAAGAVALALGLFFWVGSGQPGRSLPRRAKPAVERPSGPAASPAPGLDFRSTELRVIDPQKGRVAWELTLNRAVSASETGEAWFTGVRAVYHNLDGTDSRLSADQAHLEAGGAALVFTGAVELSAANGGKLAAGTLRWEAGREEFQALGEKGTTVDFRRGATTLRAPEIRGDLALRKVKAVGGVRLFGWGMDG